MGRFVILICAAAVFAASCASGSPGIYPYPVRVMEVEALSVPQVPVTAGETHTLSLVWSGGADTFSVTWMFGGGTTQPVMLTHGSQRESSVELTFTLEEDDPGAFSGMVQVRDDRGNSLEQAFSYTVQPQT